MRGRTLHPAALAVLAVLLLAQPAGSRPDPPPAGSGHLRASAAAASRPAAGAQPSEWWGGVYTAATGEQVRIYMSHAYPEDHARAQHWADFLAGLVHGAELSRLTAHFAPPALIRSLCGPYALGCYSPLDHTLLAPAEPSDGVSAEEIVVHEYGHHVANNRANPPWRAVDWGTKRWASHVGICARQRTGTAFPNAGERYRLHPGEAFAEVYRVLHETRAGRVDFGWSLVDWSFRPDARALRLVHEDVVRPWAPSRRTVTGSFTRAVPAVYETLLATPLDGSVSVSLQAPQGYRLEVLDPFSRRVLARGRKAERTVCGERSLLLRVVGDGRPGRFALRIVRP